jgi:hypothetical protein
VIVVTLNWMADTVTSASGSATMPPVPLGGPGMFRKALAIYAVAFVAVVAKAAIVGVGLPDWVFPGSGVVMAIRASGGAVDRVRCDAERVAH